MKDKAHRKILLLAILLVLLSPLPANAACGDGSFSEFKLTADTPPVPKSQFGQSVAVSGDTMVVGDHIQGAAYVFEYDGSNWRQVAILTPYFGWFGYSVAISGDTIAVGAPFFSSVYVFKRVGDRWIEDPEDPENPENPPPPLILNTGAPTFGWSLAFDGSILVVGTAMANLAYVFNLDGDNWPLEEAKLTASDTESTDRFGWSVAVSGDRVVVGSPWDSLVVQDPDDPGGNITLPAVGSAYVFEFDGNTWLGKKPKKLSAEDAAKYDLFGFSVATHTDTVVVGARKDSTFVPGPGAAYVFKIDGDIWSEEDKLTASDSADYDEFGYSVAIKDSTLLVGAPNDTDKDGTITGTAYLFKYDAGKWNRVQPKLTPTTEPGLEAGDQFGWSIAIDGSTIAVGAPHIPDVDSDPKAGAAYVFTPNETPVSEVYSTLGRSRHRFFPAWEIFEFTATQGDNATLIFEADANGSNNHGKGVSIFVKDKIRGVRFFSKNRWALGTHMQMDLPADGEYRVFVFGHPWYFRSKGFRGDYTLKLEGICTELRKVSRRKKW
ncbi:MAG: hypothetical protein V3U56_07915 [Syntrophobacteria bacterium]